MGRPLRFTNRAACCDNPLMAKQDTCDDCKYFVEIKSPARPKLGNCHRHPPVVTVSSGMTVKTITERPIVNPKEEWCGEFLKVTP